MPLKFSSEVKYQGTFLYQKLQPETFLKHVEKGHKSSPKIFQMETKW